MLTAAPQNEFNALMATIVSNRDMSPETTTLLANLVKQAQDIPKQIPKEILDAIKNLAELVKADTDADLLRKAETKLRQLIEKHGLLTSSDINSPPNPPPRRPAPPPRAPPPSPLLQELIKDHGLLTLPDSIPQPPTKEFLEKAEEPEAEKPELEAAASRYDAAANATDIMVVPESRVSGKTKRLLPNLVKQVQYIPKQMRQDILVAIKKLAKLVKTGASQEEIQAGEQVLWEQDERWERLRLAKFAEHRGTEALTTPRERWAYRFRQSPENDDLTARHRRSPTRRQRAGPTGSPSGHHMPRYKAGWLGIRGGTLKRRKPKKNFSRKNIIKLLETQ